MVPRHAENARRSAVECTSRQMALRMRRLRVSTLLLASTAYVVVGIGTAMLAGTASSLGGVKGWRATAWLLSLVVFLVHLAVERRRAEGRRSVAAHVALAVALGAFGVAALGPLRAHWAEPARFRLALLSIVAWPLLTGVPAFFAAFVMGALLDLAGDHRDERTA